MRRFCFVLAIATATLAGVSLAQLAPTAGPYKATKTKVGGEGGTDYIYADADARRLYIARTGKDTARVTVFNLDTLAPQPDIPGTNAHGVVVSTKSGHGFVSSKPIQMFDSKTLMPIKTIEVMGNPDGMLYDTFNDHVYILSHQAPHVTVINAADGAVLGTIDLSQHRRGGRQDHDGDGALRSDRERRHLRRPRDRREEQHSLRRVPHARQHGDPQRHGWQDHHHPSHQRRVRWRRVQLQYDGSVQLARRRHPGGDQGEQSHQFRGGAGSSDHDGRTDIDVG
jgi:hypothetical protein